jgi:leader peptidase (prepilin peptidase)/N-methyltransferase
MESNLLLILHAEFLPLVLAIAGLFGLIIGSFLNVVIYRIPVMMDTDYREQAQLILNPDLQPKERDQPFNLVFPNSHCPACQTEIKPWHNIPVLSFLLLGGKCANCQVPISIRYPAIEVLTSIVTVAIVYKFGLTITTGMALVFSWTLICLTMIDYDHYLLPDNLTLPLLWLGLVCNSFGLFIGLPDAVWGAILGYMVLWSVFWVFKWVTGKDGMGFGDLKLLAALGAWLGWQALPMVIILSSLSGALLGGYLVLRGRDRAQPIPFGPYLAIAGWLTLMWGDQIAALYFQLVLSGV